MKQQFNPYRWTGGSWRYGTGKTLPSMPITPALIAGLRKSLKKLKSK